MRISDNTVLITGGATGIGFSIAEEFAKNKNRVIICGRRENVLEMAKSRIPGLITKSCDVSKEEERMDLVDWAVSNFKDLNILVNNAGIQNYIDFKKGTSSISEEDEIDINFKAPVSLSQLLIPQFMKQKESAIINISSGLAFIPLALAPVYCATKAAIHSFSITLRHQLKNTPIRVFEIIPPIVDTGLDRGERDKRHANRGINASIVGKETIKAIENDSFEYAIGMAENLRSDSRSNFEETFNNMNRY